MAEGAFGYILSGIGLGMFVPGMLQAMSPGAEKKSWMSALAIAAIVVGVMLTG